MSANKVPFLLTACVSCLALLACDPVEDQDGFADDGDAGERLELEDGDRFESSGIQAPEVIDNSAPCGEQTLAIVHADSGATYVFCGLGDGTTGVLEELPADGSASSLLDVHATPSALLQAVLPAGQVAPERLLLAVERGEQAAGQEPEPPSEFGSITLSTPAAASAYCTSESTFRSTFGWSSYVTFLNEFVEDYADCENHLWITDNSPLVSWHQRTASNYSVYLDFGPPYALACGAKEHVVSCDGSTLFEAQRKETPSSSWTTSLSYWVTDGATATWKMYASDCRGSSDKDDMRYTGDSEPGATHRYSTIFVKWFDGGSCNFI